MKNPEQAKVFISSILNHSVENLIEERNAVRKAIDSYTFLRPWAFETAPASIEELDESYLRHVDECDIFTVIVGHAVTNPVVAEVQRAKQRNKPTLVFAKKLSSRNPMAQMLLDGVGRKYGEFENMAELEQAVRDAVDQTIVLGLRALSSAGTRSLMGELREFDARKTHFKIQPMVPSFPGKYTFHVENVEDKTVNVRLHRTSESIAIPVSRVSEILSFGERELPVVMLNGRLQWVTTIQRWRFFPEDIDKADFLGLPKPSTHQDKRAIEIADALRRWQFVPGWAHAKDVPGQISAAYQPVYDDDGKYFRVLDRPYDQILIVQRHDYPTLQA
jgi:hypothetical protein